MNSGVIDDLNTLVAFPTISTRPVTGIAAFLATRAEALGFTIERFDDPDAEGKTNVVARIGPDATAGEGLVLCGHMDVVPVDGQPWSSDPFSLTRRDGRLFGRGTADMKGFIAAALQALARIGRRRWRQPLVLLWTHDEEVGCHGSAHLCLALNEAGRRLPSACLIGEPTDFSILRMHAGHVAMRVVAQGKAAHSAFPERGANAIEAAAMAVGTLRELAATLREERDDDAGLERPFVPLNVGRIQGGEAINLVADRCEIELGFRPLPGMGHGPLVARVEKAIAAIEPPPGTALRVELLRVTPSMCTPADTELERALAAEADTSEVGAAAYATDGGNLAGCGCAPLIYGPGSILVAHQANEYVTIDALHRTIDVVERLVRARCQPY